MSSDNSDSDANRDEDRKQRSRKVDRSDGRSKDKDSKRTVKAEAEDDAGPKNALKSSESSAAGEAAESVSKSSGKSRTKKTSSKVDLEGKTANKASRSYSVYNWIAQPVFDLSATTFRSMPRQRNIEKTILLSCTLNAVSDQLPAVPDPVSAVAEGTTYNITVDANGVSFVAKSKGTQVVRWPFVVGAAKMTQDSSSESVSFLFCQLEKLKDKIKSSGVDDAPQLKPSDPDQFSALKIPKLKLATWNLKFESATVASSWVENLHNHLESLGQKQGLRISVFLNPFSGTKKAMKVWKKVEPVFAVNGAVISTHWAQFAGPFSLLSLQLTLTIPRIRFH
jgi:hypothetical protein